MQSIKHTKAFTLLSVLLAVFALLCCFAGLSASADPAPGVAQTKQIAHISDVHYFPYDDCYNVSDTTSDAFRATEFYKSIASDTKLINQSGTIVSATFQSIVAQSPDYLIVSGDITRDGELRAHYDIANALRYLQNYMRTEGGKPDFQIFTIPGNHDLYNGNASVYDGEGHKIKLESNRTTAKAFSVIYNGLGYPAMTLSELEADADGQKMLDYFDEITLEQEHPLTSKYILSEIASHLSIQYYFDEIGFPVENDPAFNCLSYIAKTTDGSGYAFTMFDSTLREAADPDESDLYWEHLTGGRATTACLEWVIENTEDCREDNFSIVASIHHNLAPHYSMEENFTKDFTVYNWEDTSTVFADEIGVRYAFSGHMHAIDRAQFVTYNNNVLHDFETGSLVSLNSPTRFVKITRAFADGVLTEDVYTTTVAINTLEGIISSYLDEPANENAVCLFDEVTDLEHLIGDEIYDKLVQRLLDSFVNDSLFDTVTGLLNGLDVAGLIGSLNISALNFYINAVDGLFLIVNKLLYDAFYNFDYNLSGIEADSLVDFVHKLLYSDQVLGIVVWEEDGVIYTVEKVLIWAYRTHLAGNEPAYLDGLTPMSRATKNTVELLENGTIVETLLNGVLKPLLLDNNSILEQLLTHKIDLSAFTETADIDAIDDFMYTFFGRNWGTGIGTSVSLNDILSSAPVQILLPIIANIFGGSGTIGTVLSYVEEALNTGLIDWARDFIGKYLTDSLYASLGGLIAEVAISFSTDATPDGVQVIFGTDLSNYKENPAWTHVSNGFEGYGDLTYSGSPVAADKNIPTFADGRLPSMLTSTFGDDAATSQNFKWYTNYKVSGLFQYREKGASAWIDVTPEDPTYTVVIRPVAVPLIDLGLFATKTAATYKLDKVEYEYTLSNREQAVTDSVKFAAVHSVSLVGLKADTVYEYRVSGTYGEYVYCLQDYTVEGQNKYYSFATALPEGDQTEYTFLAFTDIQGTILSSYLKAAEALTAAASVSPYRFLVNCGDVVDSGSNVKQWSYAQNALTNIFGNTSTVVSSGNHDESDYALTNYYNFGNLGSTDTISGAYFSFNYGRVHFIVLNTNDLAANASGLSAGQLAWLNADFDAVDDSKTDYTVVVMHKSIYSVGSHTDDADVVALRGQLTSLFYDNKVNLVLAGHDHTFSATQLLDGQGNVVKNAVTTDSGITLGSQFEGVLYMTLGTIADKFYEYRRNDAIESKFNPEQTVYQMIDTPTFASIKVSADALTISTYAYADLNGDGVKEVVTLAAYKASLAVDSTPAEDNKDYSVIAAIILGADIALALAIIAIIIKKKVIA